MSGPRHITARVRIPESVLNESYQDANTLQMIADLIDTAIAGFVSVHCYADNSMVNVIKTDMATMARRLRDRAQEIEDDNA